jgi:hypothetical protein
VLANQHRGIVKSYGKVDYIILDSPILLSLVYRNYYRSGEYPATLYGDSFDKMVLDIHNQYDTLNIVLNRSGGVHNEKERYQNLDQSKELDTAIESTLIDNKINFIKVEVNDFTVSNILSTLLDKKNQY